MTGDAAVPPGDRPAADHDPAPEERFQGMGLSAEQRRMVRMLLIVAGVAIAWAVVAIVIAVG